MYQGDRDGFNQDIFRSKVKNEFNLFIIIKTTKGNIFGSFRSKPFMFDRALAYKYFNNRFYSFQYDEKTFLFSLVNNYNNSIRIDVKDPGYALTDLCLNEGPILGIEVLTYFDSYKNLMFGHAKVFPWAYQKPISDYLKNEAISIFYSGYYFEVSNIEIYKTDCKFKINVYL